MVIKDADGIFHKVLTSEHVTAEVVEQAIERLEAAIDDLTDPAKLAAKVALLGERLEAARADLEVINRG